MESLHTNRRTDRRTKNQADNQNDSLRIKIKTSYDCNIILYYLICVHLMIVIEENPITAKLN